MCVVLTTQLFSARLAESVPLCERDGSRYTHGIFGTDKRSAIALMVLWKAPDEIARDLSITENAEADDLTWSEENAYSTVIMEPELSGASWLRAPLRAKAAWPRHGTQPTRPNYCRRH